MLSLHNFYRRMLRKKYLKKDFDMKYKQEDGFKRNLMMLWNNG